MLSSDKNVETIAQLVEQLKHYVELQTEYVKLDVVERVVRLFTILVISAMLVLLLFIALIFLSIALAQALVPLVGGFGAYAIVAMLYILLLLLCLAKRKSWIEKPLVRMLAGALMD